jgi:hypothetical protein
MKRTLITMLILAALPAFAVDVVLGRISQATLAGSGLNRVWGFGGGSVSPLSIYYSGATPADNSTQASTNATVQVTTTITNEHSVTVNFDSSLVGWWRGESNAVDSVGTNNGTWSGTEAYAAGKYGTAINIDGNNSITTPLVVSNRNLTIVAWIKGKSNSHGGFIGSTNDAPYKIFWFGHEGVDDFMTLYFGNGITFESFSSDTILDLSAWNQVACVISDTGVTFYDNGNRASTGDFTISATMFTVALPPIGYRGFIGSIDDVQIYNRALSSNEVASLYNAQASQYTNTFASLSNGVHTLRAYAQDTAGNVTNTEQRIFTVSP